MFPDVVQFLVKLQGKNLKKTEIPSESFPKNGNPSIDGKVSPMKLYMYFFIIKNMQKNITQTELVPIYHKCMGDTFPSIDGFPFFWKALRRNFRFFFQIQTPSHP